MLCVARCARSTSAAIITTRVSFQPIIVSRSTRVALEEAVSCVPVLAVLGYISTFTFTSWARSYSTFTSSSSSPVSKLIVRPEEHHHRISGQEIVTTRKYSQSRDRKKTRPETRAGTVAMSSPYKIHVTPDNTGLLKVPQTEEAAEKASVLLQEDLEVCISGIIQFFFKNLFQCYRVIRLSVWAAS